MQTAATLHSARKKAAMVGIPQTRRSVFRKRVTTSLAIAPLL
jgi:hypothetical protein